MPDGRAFELLLDIMSRLRGSAGCPWDKEQTHDSLEPYLIEEAYEVIDAIEKKHAGRLKEELGDLLLQVVFHAQIAAENRDFSISEVLEGITDKLVRRHPHVFGNLKASTPEEVVTRWEEIKKHEKHSSSLLADVPTFLPSLHYAYMLQRKAAKTGFDWQKKREVIEKIEEEIEELKRAHEQMDQSGGRQAVQEEIGDALFAVVNFARHAGIDPEIALHKAAQKFKQRFEHIEVRAKQRGKNVEQMSLDEMEALWEEAKKRSIE